jgi:ABC-type taurine transport system ATPase subunit
MQTIETTVVVLPDGSIHIPPYPGLPPGKHRAVLVVEETLQPPTNERDHATAALRAAGLLSEPSLAMQQLAAESTLTREEARAILDRAGGKPLSELVLELRGPKG